jgi:hypothetical protein
MQPPLLDLWHWEGHRVARQCSSSNCMEKFAVHQRMLIRLQFTEHRWSTNNQKRLFTKEINEGNERQWPRPLNDDWDNKPAKPTLVTTPRKNVDIRTPGAASSNICIKHLCPNLGKENHVNKNHQPVEGKATTWCPCFYMNEYPHWTKEAIIIRDSYQHSTFVTPKHVMGMWELQPAAIPLSKCMHLWPKRLIIWNAKSIPLFGEHPCRRSFQKVELAKIWKVSNLG